MEDITFKTLKDNNLITVNSDTLFLNKRVLICSLVNPKSKTANLYLKHLVECQKKYSLYGIDRIYVINSPDNVWSMLIPKIDNFFPELTPLLDHKGKFAEYLKKNIKNNQSMIVDEPWSYQVLINNKKIEKFYESQQKDFLGYEEYTKILKYVKKNIEKISLKETKNYENKKQNLLSIGLNMLISSLKNKKHYDYRDLEKITEKSFRYNSLWPNTKLEEYLQIKK